MVGMSLPSSLERRARARWVKLAEIRREKLERSVVRIKSMCLCMAKGDQSVVISTKPSPPCEIQCLQMAGRNVDILKGN